MVRPIFINGRFVTQNLSGVQRFAGEIVRAMSEHWRMDQGTKPIILAPEGHRDPSIDLGFEIRTTGRLKGQLWEQFDLPRAARGGVLLNLGNTAPLSVRRQVVVLHDAAVFAQPSGYSWKFRAWYTALQNVLSRTGTKLVTVSDFSRDELSRYLHVSADRIAVIPEGAEHILRETPDNTVLTRHDLVGRPFVLVVGNLAPHKNLAALGHLARELAQRNVPLVISGGMNKTVFSGTASLPEPAQYIGRVTDAELHALYQAASCFVFPSLYEGFGLPSVEAMACGCPVVASNIPASMEICADAALYADPLSPPSFTAAVMRLLDNPDLAKQMRAEGLERAKHFTWSRAANELLQMTRKVGAK